MTISRHTDVPYLDQGVMIAVMTIAASAVLKDLERLLLVLRGDRSQPSLLQDSEGYNIQVVVT